jgi:phage baseplate assembly protein gpV
MFSQYFWGKVTENADPDGLNRVRVTKLAEEDSVTDWIPVLTSFVGNDAGLSLLPDIDDQVLVVSLDSSNIQKVVLGSIWSDEVAPPESGENADADLNQDGKNSLKFYKSRAGNMIIFDDTENKEKIQLISSDGDSRLELSVADELLTLSTKTDLSISAKGVITIQAEEIAITSEKQFNVETEDYQISSSKAMNIEADKDVGMKGSELSLN